MRHKKISFRDTDSAFSPFFLDYIDQKDTLADFYHRFPNLKAFKKQIEDKKKSFSSADRHTLYSTLKEQYKELIVCDTVKHNIESLQDNNTFTITTGHQLNIFTGPLYVIYKIVSTINLCKQLKKAYPSYTFVPLYWMASEDHDFEEINHFRLYDKTYTWETKQQGGVGRFDTQGLNALLEEGPGNIALFKEAYLKHSRLSDAVRYYINKLFGYEGLLVVDADCSSLKTALTKVVTDDIFKHTPKHLIEESRMLLNKNGYKPKVHVRDINFFYLTQNQRNRIERVKNKFLVHDTKIEWDEDQIKKHILQEPEKFSPNVVIRPLYQEIILPNLAYIGGPSEITYWLLLKQVFDHYKTPFPILIPRSFALIMNGPIARKFEKTGLNEKNLFENTNQLHKLWIGKHTTHSIALDQEKLAIQSLFDQIEKKFTQIDPTMKIMVRAEAKSIANRMQKIEHKLLRAEKLRHANALRQIDEVKGAIFPGGILQERTDNFLNFYQQDPNFIQKLVDRLDPLDFRFNILSYPFT